MNICTGRKLTRLLAVPTLALAALAAAPAHAGISATGTDPATACQGQDLHLQGSFGAPPANYRVYARVVGHPVAHIWDKAHVSWSPSALTIHLDPGALPAGSYRFVADTFGTDGTARWDGVTVTTCSAPPPPPPPTHISLSGYSPVPACLGHPLTLNGSFSTSVLSYTISMTPLGGSHPAHSWSGSQVTASATHLGFTPAASDLAPGNYKLTVDAGELGTAQLQPVQVRNCHVVPSNVLYKYPRQLRVDPRTLHRVPTCPPGPADQPGCVRPVAPPTTPQGGFVPQPLPNPANTER